MAQEAEGDEVADYLSVPSWVGSGIAAIFLALSGYALKTANEAYYTTQQNTADIRRIDANQQAAMRDLAETRTSAQQSATAVAGLVTFDHTTDERLQALRSDAQQLHDQIYRMIYNRGPYLTPEDREPPLSSPQVPRDGRSPR